MTYDGTTGRMYINGKLVNTNIGTYVPPVGVVLPVDSGTGGVYYPQATIDEIKYYNYSLTDTEVALDYNQGGGNALGVGTEAGDTGTAPVGWWKLDDNTGINAVDSSGNGATGTLTSGPTWSVGKNGSGVKLDGTDDNISLGSPASLNITGNITISAWVKISDLSHSNTVYSNTSGWDTGTVLRIDATNGNIIFFYNPSGTRYHAEGGPVTPNVWTYLTVVHENGVNKVYKNGIDTKATSSSILTANSMGASKLGQLGTSTSYNVSGIIDDVKIYNYARSQAQIAYDYNRGKPIGYWSFDESDGNTARDFSGQGNNGTLTNMEPANDDPTSGMLSQSGLISFTAANAVDNNTVNYAWHTDTSVAGSYLQVDLGSGVTKAYTKTRIYATGGGYAGNYSVQYSDNGTTWVTAATNFIPSSAGWNEKSWSNMGDHRYWRLYLTNTPGGGSWLDELEFYGVNWFGGKLGKGLYFDGVNDYVNINSAAYRFDSGDFTASVWASTNVLDATYDGLLTTDLAGDSAWKIIRNQGNNYFEAKYNSTNLSFPAVNVNEWHAYTMTKSGTILSIYLDGRFITSGTCPSTHPVAANSLVLGSYRINDAATGTHMFNGKMDDVRIYNYALTAAQVQQAIIEGAAVRF